VLVVKFPTKMKRMLKIAKFAKILGIISLAFTPK